MEAIILDSEFEPVAIFENFQSFIWTERYDSASDFELYASADSGILSLVAMDTYISIAESDRIMIVEKIEINNDVESGDFVTVTGRSLESILERRIVWNQTTINGNLQNGVKQLLNENLISPSDSNRKIDNFIFEESTDTKITDLTIETQFIGDTLYSAISDICAYKELGFSVKLNNSKQFVFKLYLGIDRSYSQTENLFVTFSNDFDNIISSDYSESYLEYKNVLLVTNGNSSTPVTTSVGSGTGLTRREGYFQPSDLGTSDVTADILKTKGETELKELAKIATFTGEMDTANIFRYRTDFTVGDIVQIVDKYGHKATSRVTEIIISQDENGYTTYPTLADAKLSEETT